ncbi:MAG: hypothetical protein KGZ86_08200 [Candidatus Latescibacteria bacterium]|nr:hypothetical protein [Candidatus Latescibacterota bacterium]
MNIIRAGILYKFGRIVLVLFVVIVSLSSLCKHKPEENYLEPVNVSNNSGRSERPSIAVDSRNTVHLVWNDDTPGNEEIFYAMKSANGSWSEPVQVTYNIGASRSPYITIDRTDKIHLAWQQVVYQGNFSYWKIFYTWRNIGDTWATPETISVYGASNRPILAVDDELGLHLFWREAFAPDQCLYHYAHKANGGQWQIQYLFTKQIASYEMIVDDENGVHVVLDPYMEIYYIEKRPDGTWADTMRISYSPVNDWQTSDRPSIAVSSDGSIHVVWAEGDTALSGVAYRRKTIQGGWGQIEPLYKGKVSFSEPKICIGNSDRIHLIWMMVDINYGINSNGVWQEPRTLYKNVNYRDKGTMTIDSDEKIYYAWSYGVQQTFPINYEIYFIEFK